MVISLIKNTISGLKLARDITKALLELDPISDVKAKVIELQEAILAAQDSAFEANAHQTAMVEKIRNLEKEITRIKAWEEEKQRYKLVSPWPGTVLYALKKERGSSEEPHWICTNCYEEGRKSILHPQKKGTWFVCPACKGEFYGGPHRANPPDPEYASI